MFIRKSLLSILLLKFQIKPLYQKLQAVKEEYKIVKSKRELNCAETTCPIALNFYIQRYSNLEFLKNALFVIYRVKYVFSKAHEPSKSWLILKVFKKIEKFHNELILGTLISATFSPNIAKYIKDEMLLFQLPFKKMSSTLSASFHSNYTFPL